MKPILLVLLLCGCSTMESTSGFVLCKAADLYTTQRVISSGRGYEANPAMQKMVSPSILPAVVLSAIVYLGLREADSPGLNLFANVLTCGAAINNVGVYEGVM